MQDKQYILALVKKVNDNDPKFKFSDIVRISKYKSFFAKGYVLNWSGEAFMIRKVKNSVPWVYVISDHKGEEIVGTFYNKEFKTKKSNRV